MKTRVDTALNTVLAVCFAVFAVAMLLRMAAP